MFANFFMSRWQSELLGLLRVVTGLLFIEHGTSKLLGFPPSPMQPPLMSLAGIAGVFELVGGALIILGLFTRPVAFVLSGQMAIAYWLVHAKMGPFPLVNHGELAILYCFVFLYLSAAGGGRWSLDGMMARR